MGLTEEEELELLELENENERLRIESTKTNKPNENKYNKSWKDVVTEPFKNLGESYERKKQNINAPTTLARLTGAKRGTLEEAIISQKERQLRSVLNLTGLAGETVGSFGEAAFNAGDKLTGGKISNTLGALANKTGLTSLAAKANQAYKTLPADIQANLDAVGASTSALGVFGGGKLGSMALKTGFKNTAKKATANTLKNSVDNIAENTFKNTTENIAEKIPKLEDLNLKDIKKGNIGLAEQFDGEIVDLSKVKKIHPLIDLPESDIRTLSAKPAKATIPFGEYANYAINKKKGTKALDPFELAATNATRAFKEIDAIKKNTGESINKIIASNADKKIDISNAKNKFLEAVDERIGGLKKDEIMTDPSAGKTIEDIGNTLLNVPDEIDPKTAWRLKQNLRNKLKYDVAGQLRPKNTVLDGILKEVSNLIDRKMDTTLDGFKEANDRYRDFAKIEDALSRALGAEFVPGSGLTKHGASIMKRVIESNADSNIRDIFRQVEKLTNNDFDLFQDAVYASVAMRLSGDARQIRKALPLDGIPDALTKNRGSGGVISRAGDFAIDKTKALVKNRELDIVKNWYNKKHNKIDFEDLAKMKQFVKK